MPRRSHFVLCVLALLACLCSMCEARVALSFLGLSVSRGARSRNRARVESRPSLYDEYGQIPQVQNAYRAISRGKQLVTFRTNNSTVVAYGVGNPERSLLVSSGCKPFYMISPGSANSTRHHVLLTGVAGDCRTVVRYLKQLALNHTVEFESAPSAEYLSTRLGEFLQSYLSGGAAGRMLACHCYLISDFVDKTDGSAERVGGERGDRRIGSIYEVTAVGGVSRILAGTIGGSHVQAARRALKAGYTTPQPQSGNSSRALVQEIFRARGPPTSSDDSDDSGGEDKLAMPTFQYIELFDN